jgi:hypothetical protein
MLLLEDDFPPKLGPSTLLRSPDHERESLHVSGCGLRRKDFTRKCVRQQRHTATLGRGGEWGSTQGGHTCRFALHTQDIGTVEPPCTCSTSAGCPVVIDDVRVGVGLGRCRRRTNENIC